MRKLLNRFLLLFSLVVCIGATAQTKTETIRFADYGVTGGTNLSEISALNNLESVKLAFYANGAESAPKYYTMGARFYVGNAMTIKAKENIVVDDIVVNYVFKANITDNAAATFSNCTYEYDSQGPFGIISNIDGVVSMINTSSRTANQGNQVWISSLTVSFHEVETAVESPIISSSEGQLFKRTNTITISCPTQGATIYYSINSPDDPDQNSTIYQGPFTINESTTVRAMAVANGETSKVVYKEFFYTTIPDNVAWYESFDNVNGVGGNDGVWENLFEMSPLEGTDKEWFVYDDEDYYPGEEPPHFNKVYSGSRCAFVGDGGKLVVKHINITGNGKMYFWAESMGNSGDAVTVRIDARPFDGFVLGEGEVCGRFIGNGSTVTVNNNYVEFGDCGFSIATVKPLSRSGRFTLFQIPFERLTMTDRITISFPVGNAGFIDEVYFVLDEPETVEVTFDDLLFTTIFYSKMGFIVPQGIRAYHFGIDGTTHKIVKEYIFKPGDVIPQGMAVVLKADASGTYFLKEAYSSPNYFCMYQKGFDEEAMTDNFWSQYGYPPEDDYIYYRLRTKNNTVGFFFSPGCPEGEPFMCPAHESFFVVPMEISNHYGYPIAALSTDIDDIFADTDDAELDVLYNLNGQRVDRSYRGVVISKGKKWINK